MNRFASILLIACFLSLGSGVAERLHNAQHTAEDAAAAIKSRLARPIFPLRH